MTLKAATAIAAAIIVAISAILSTLIISHISTIAIFRLAVGTFTVAIIGAIVTAVTIILGKGWRSER